MYELVHVGSEKCTLRDILNGNEFEIKREKLVKENLSLPYCRTGHVVQGRSVSGNVVIFDSKLSGLVTRNWLYVVVTRARDLSKVFYVENAVETMCTRQIENKIWSYKKQDITAGRFWKREKELSVDYIQGLSKKQGHVCFLCGGIMNFVNKLDDPNNWSVDRLNDSLAHVRGNCKLSHISCNVGKGDVV